GLQGGKDPDCRRAFPWQEEDWDVALRKYVRRLIDLRKRNPVLRRGSYQTLYVREEDGVMAFGRRLGEERILVILNASSSGRYLQLDVGKLGWQDDRILQDMLNANEYRVSDQGIEIELQPWSGYWIGNGGI
ncbi:MAG: alpha-glucosidase C-terminal domain-containing protein, partial [Anaerolineales bacterium]|nr:alpha-glucosidase C-terminal domain-containing protein [Anaerolineales bacterium]